MRKIVFLFWFLACVIAGQDQPNQDSRSVGNSPFPAPDGHDAAFVTDQDPTLDVFLFRNQGPISFDINITRYVAPVDSNGYLQNVQTLIDNGIISSDSILRLPVWDVDETSPCVEFGPEIDKVYVNGHYLGNLSGGNQTWKDNVFKVPVRYLKFPPPGGTAANHIEVRIDQANIGNLQSTCNGDPITPTDNFWAVEIDWAELSIETVRPVLMVHGILSSPAAWDLWVDQLNNIHFPNDTLDVGALDSIAANAGKIATKVQTMKQQFGVDRVNLLGHSHGGLDSRHYAEYNGDVEIVMQLATPNGGSPLADYIQAGLIVLHPLAVIIGALAAPAGYELTTGHMAIYNSGHGSHPNTTYHAIAGDWQWLFLDGLPLIPGRDDLVVPVWSVHTLPYTQDYTWTRSDSTATHTGINASLDVFQAYNHILKPFGNPLPSDTPEAPEAPLIGANDYRTSNRVMGSVEDGQTISGSFQLGAYAMAEFSVILLAGNTQLTLETPDGVMIDPALAASDPDITFWDQGQDYFAAGYFIENPTAGTWQYRITGADIGEGPTGFMFQTSVPDDGRVFIGEAQATGETRQPGVRSRSYRMLNSVTLSVSYMDNGSPVTGQTVQAGVLAPSGKVTGLDLFDDGLHDDGSANDGVYANQYSPAETGRYSVDFNSGPVSSSESFRADVFFQVHSSDSVLTGDLNDLGVDTNGNGLLDFLELLAEVDFQDTGDFRLTADLEDSNGNFVQSQFIELNVATTGLLRLPIRFPGEVLFESRTDGPYNIRNIQLFKKTGEDFLPTGDTMDHVTDAWLFVEFEHPPIFINQVSDELLIDVDNNDLYDILRFRFDLNLPITGNYSLSGRLTNGTNDEFDFVSETFFMLTGDNAVTLDFNGFQIGKRLENGPYYLRNLVVTGPTSLLLDTELSTAAHDYQLFEGAYCVAFDFDQNGLINSADQHLMGNSWLSADAVYDYDNDGLVSILDLANLVICKP